MYSVKKIAFSLLMCSFAIVYLVGCQTNKTLTTLNTEESNYEHAISMIQDHQISEAKKILEGLNGYKNSDNLLEYVNALDVMEKDSANYNYGLNYLSKIPNDYTGELYKEISDYRNELTQIKKKNDEIASEQSKQREVEIVNLIKNGSYTKAINECIQCSSFPTLHRYAMALDYEKKGDLNMAIYTLAEIPSDYDGAMANEIHQSQNKYSKEINDLKVIQAEQSKVKPKIGMTAEEVLQSSWGKPDEVNRTVTATVTHEQWVYSDNKYIYLDNGVVTAIQDSQ